MLSVRSGRRRQREREREREREKPRELNVCSQTFNPSVGRWSGNPIKFPRPWKKNADKCHVRAVSEKTYKWRSTRASDISEKNVMVIIGRNVGHAGGSSRSPTEKTESAEQWRTLFRGWFMRKSQISRKYCFCCRHFPFSRWCKLPLSFRLSFPRRCTCSFESHVWTRACNDSVFPMVIFRAIFLGLSSTPQLDSFTFPSCHLDLYFNCLRREREWSRNEVSRQVWVVWIYVSFLR